MKCDYKMAELNAVKGQKFTKLFYLYLLHNYVSGENPIFLAMGTWTSVSFQHYWNISTALEDLYFERPVSSALVLIKYFFCERSM